MIKILYKNNLINIYKINIEYFKLSLREKDIYFSIDINKYLAYSAHNIDFHDYHIVINEIDIWDKNIDFNDKYGGLFLCFNENKEIIIYDNIKKIYIDIENNNDIKSITYFHYGVEWNDISLKDAIKEILYKIFVN